jgi:hypothetical protein
MTSSTGPASRHRGAPDRDRLEDGAAGAFAQWIDGMPGMPGRHVREVRSPMALGAAVLV